MQLNNRDKFKFLCSGQFEGSLQYVSTTVSASSYGTDIADAIAAIGSSSVTLIVDSPITVNENATTHANTNLIVQRPGLFTVASGKTLTINSPFTAGAYQIFDGTGAVVGLREARPEWFGTGGLVSAIAAVSAGGVVRVSQGYSETVSATITINKNMTILGDNKTDASITGPNDAPIFTGSGTVTQLIIRGITFVGGSGNSQLLKATSVTAWSEARITIENCNINNFGAYAIELGNSIYMHDIRRNRFRGNYGCISEGFASDGVIDDNQFYLFMGTNPVIKTQGGAHTVISNNIFIHGTLTVDSGTGADIEFNPTAVNGRGGRAHVYGNKFGGEGEIASRPKIRVYNATAGNRSVEVHVIGNQFHGANLAVGGTTHAFQFDNPIYNWAITLNEFDNYDTIVNDNFALTSGTSGPNIFKDNQIYQSTRLGTQLFLNNGRGFTEVSSIQTGDDYGRTERFEPRKVQNRLKRSSAIDSITPGAGTTITAGQTDPLGGSTAYLIERDGTATNQNFACTIDSTNFKNKLYVRFWAKAGTTGTAINQVWVGVSASGLKGPFMPFGLTTEWKEYGFVVNDTSGFGSTSVVFYIGNTTAVSGSFYIYAPQVSDYPSDYIPTPSNAGITDTTITRYFNGRTNFAGGLRAVVPIYANNTAAISGGLVAGDFYRTGADPDSLMIVH